MGVLWAHTGAIVLRQSIHYETTFYSGVSFTSHGDDAPLIVLEYMQFGDLKNFLQTYRSE